MATFNLQTGPDNISGGNSDDTFIATYNDGMTGTFAMGDALNGNAGIDTLDITPIGVAAITPPDTLFNNISNIEKIVINPTGDGAQTITTGAAFQSAFAVAGVNLKTTSGAGAITTNFSSFTGALTLTTISDAGAQTITTGAGPSTVMATSTAGAQTITTGAEPSTVMATSTAGVQTITTGAGADVITATTTAADNIINAGAGNDTVTILPSATGNYTINGNDGDDNISGGAANDTLNGGIGNDILIGFNPNNSSLGRGEIDNLFGGAGSDRFVLGVGYDDGSNTSNGAADFADIKDFNIGEGDVIQLTGSSADYLLTVVGADTQILINKPGGEPDELIGLIRGQTGLSLTQTYFSYNPPVFAIASAAATEGGVITFTVTRTGDAQANQSVTVATSIGGNETASANDFTANNQILIFAQGETTKNFTVQTTQDAVLEGNETFTATLTAPTNGATISPTNGTATGTINDDESAPVFAIASAAATEGGAITFTVTRTGNAQASQSVTVATSIGGNETASANDFTANNQILIFAQGETTKNFTVQTTQDAVLEGNETFTATLTAPTNGATISPTNGTATGTINDDESAPVFAIASAAATEGGAITFTVTRTGDAQANQSVTVATSIGGNETASANDFTANNQILIFAQGETTKNFTVQTTQDAVLEGNETFTATLTAPTNGATISPTNGTATGTINDDESAPVFAIASAAATEGGVITFTVTRTGDAQANQSVTVTASIGATDNVISASDFTAKTETLSFAQGETTKTFSVQTTQDTLFESNETFTATLSAPTNGATISTTNGTATGTINDDDPAPIFAIASVSATEGGLLNFTVTRTGNAQANQSVTVATSISGSNTTSTNDFTAKNETLIFAQDETTKTFSVQSAQDNLFEGNETFTTTLSAATNGATISSTNGLATGTINNDDPNNATLSRGNNDVFKLDGAPSAKIKASLTGANSSFVNEVGVFIVDDASGKIGSFSMGSAGYAQAALERSEIIFSAIANKPAGYNPFNTRLVDVPESNLEFYLIKSGTTTEEALKSNNFSNVLFSQNSAQITNLGGNAFAIGWNDGSGNNDFTSLELKVEGSDDALVIGTQQQGNSFSGNGGGEVIDLRFSSGLAADTKSVNADFVVNREAAFNNFVGFYKVTDTNGGIDINGDGVADFTPGQSGYSTAVVQNRVAGIDLTVSNQGTASFTGKTFEANSIFAPFIIVNGNTSSFADSNTSNDPTVYFSYLGANTDGVDHIRLLGSNTFGFEDLAGGGDRDYNDMIIKVKLG